MTWRCIETTAELAALGGAWDAALLASGRDNPFLLTDFLLTFARHFVREGDLRVLALYDGSGALVGGLPLCRARRRHWPRWPTLRVIGEGFANRTEPFYHPGAVGAEEFGAALGEELRGLPGWRSLTLPLARAPLETRLPGAIRRAGSNACIRMAGGAAAHAATLRPRMRTNLRRCLRAAAAAGGIEFRRHDALAEVAELIELHLGFSRALRHGRGRDEEFPQAAWEAFTRDLAATLARAGRLDAMALRIGGTVAACGFGFRFGPGYKSMLISHDRARARLGPGFVFLYHLIDWCHEQGEPYLDMYADIGEPDKRRWRPDMEPLYAVRLFRPGWSGQALARVAGRRGRGAAAAGGIG